MAIYDLDSMNESKKNDFNEEMLDNMLEACEYMVDTINESKARQKMGEINKNNIEKAKKELEYREDLNREFPSDKHKNDIKSTRDKINNLGYESKYYTNSVVKDDVDEEDIYRDQIKEDEFRKRYGIPRKGHTGDESIIGRRKPGTIKALADKKKAIKETCLYILSALDDIE